MKYFLALCGLITTIMATGQTPQGTLFGGFESNSQWLLDDFDLKVSESEPGFIAPEDAFRANSYFQLNYNIIEITCGKI